MPTIDWNGDDGADGGIYAGELTRGLSWVACAAPADEQPTDGSTEFIASTASVDRMGDSIDQQTWKLASYRKNPVILFEHRAGEVIGRGKVGLRKGEDGKAGELRVRVTWDESDANPTALLVAHQHKNGFRQAVSVGFLPGEAKSRKDLPEGDPLRVTGDVSRRVAGYVYRHNELLEVSSVGVPANRDALQLSLHARETDDEDEAIRRFVGGSVEARVRDLILEAVQHDKRIRRAIQAAYLGTPHDQTTPVGPRWVG